MGKKDNILLFPSKIAAKPHVFASKPHKFSFRERAIDRAKDCLSFISVGIYHTVSTLLVVYVHIKIVIEDYRSRCS